MDLEKYRALLLSQDLSFEEKLGFIMAWELGDASDAVLAVALNAHLKQRAHEIRQHMVAFQSQRLKVAQPPPKPSAAQLASNPHLAVTSMTEAEYQVERAELIKKITWATQNLATDPHAGTNLELNGRRLARLDKRMGRKS